MKFNRNLEELREHAVLHWPQEILEKADQAGNLTLLLKTQETFISVLNVANKHPDS